MRIPIDRSGSRIEGKARVRDRRNRAGRGRGVVVVASLDPGRGPGQGIVEAARDRAGVHPLPDVVEDGNTGLLVPPRDPEALAGAILRMLTDDRLRENIAKSAFTQSRGYDYRSMVYKTIAAYRQLTGAST